jgi:hypothetical protein
MVFWLNLTQLVEKERFYNFFHGGPLLTGICSVLLRFSPFLRILYSLNLSVFGENVEFGVVCGTQNHI